MILAIILLVLFLGVYVCRHDIKRAVRSGIRKAEKRLAKLVIAALKGLLVLAVTGAGRAYRALRLA